MKNKFIYILLFTLIGCLPVSAADTDSKETSVVPDATKEVALKEKKEHKKKKGKGKILIPPNDEDIVLTLDGEEKDN